MGKEAILEKIQTDAKLRADAMVSEANAKADEILAEAAEKCKIYFENSKNEIHNLKIDIEKRSQTVAELDAKKLLLKAKTQVVNDTFALALEKLKNLPEESYKKLILGMLEAVEDGDTVTISKREKGIITKDVVNQIAKEKGIKLKLNAKLGDFDGGIVLSGGGIDKNLTLEVELALLRDLIEADIAKELLD